MARRSRLLRIVAASSALGVIGQPAHADTLQEALERAYESNPTLNAARANLRATDEDVALAKAQGRPSVSADANYSEFLETSSAGSSSISSRPDRSFSVSATLSVPVYQGGGVRNRVKAAETRVDSGRANLRGTESSIFSQVVAAYMDVIGGAAVLELRQANVNTLSTNLEASRDRFEIGDLTRTDVAQSDARLALALANLEVAESNLIQFKENYIALVGEAPADLQPPPPLPGLPSSVQEAVAVAVEHNPDLIAAREDAEAALYTRRASDSGRLPSVSVFAQPGYDNYLGSAPSSSFNIPGVGSLGGGTPVEQSGTSLTLGVRASIPLYRGGAGSAEIRQSQARLSAAQENLIGTERDIIAQVRSAYSSWRSSLQVISASERQVEAAELSLEGTRAENTVGLRSVLDILNAEQERVDAEVQLVTARRNAYVAGFSLLAAMGRAEARDLNFDTGMLYDPTPNYDRASSNWFDWLSVPDEPEPVSTRTVDTPAQTAETR